MRKMPFRFFSIILSSALILGSLSVLAAGPAKIVLGFVPSTKPEVLKAKASDLARLIEDRLNVPVEVVVPEKYEAIVEGMKDKKIDFAFFTSLTFVEAEETANAKVLLKKVWNTPFYYSAIVVSRDSSIKNLAGLKGKKFGFIDEKSTSGFLYPSAMFKRKNIDPKKYFSDVRFFGDHDSAIAALGEGKVDAVAVFSDDAKATVGAWTNSKVRVRSLWVSEPIPNDPFCVRRDFYERYPRYTHDLMFLLIDLQDEDQGVLQKLFGIRTMALATSRQYDPVRSVVKYLRENGKSH